MSDLLNYLQSIAATSEKLLEPENPNAARFTDAVLHTHAITDLIRDTQKEELIAAEFKSLPKDWSERLASENPADYVACIEELLDIYPMQGGREYLETLVEKYNLHMSGIENLENVLLEQKEQLQQLEKRQTDQVSARENILQRETSEIQRLEREIEKVKQLIQS
ncbi:DASH complex subunit Spc34 [Schizosaccharomyces pombe]|uniref:DASH complex subunit spc34 n=1 Tax=Schizosaccharomyces pombe (strain 972 / ATCC 24843) TaxID=284812 RepID=SPC34_SCHPO|nr:DASH complex subunit Spc34 [Schizosaccharomyces pombe]O14285.1 RecName: Full=DASH complex subunit spc34; AltName: Full=Outer kinetochore protein spc34 [Schizosaccharomyces pombe 972h-]CAB16304.1 DASH complex subunit Spc34 [Schizosaccharomyces pombe]|eukprot:NP_594287.1 DASH complex subunit Spc34 [Schizosaccharomyces pombe]